MSATDTAAEAAQALFSDVSPGWQRWDAELVDATRPATEALLAAVRITPGMRVLDVACRTGEPALSIAPLLGPHGHVTATDVSAAMVTFAEARARREGLPNMSFQVADAADLHFDDAQFDVVTSRMGVMFFARDRALAELRRVLKPGGRVGFTAWGAYEHNPWLSAVRDPVVRRLRARPDSASGPDIFRYAVPGTLSADLRNSGFRGVREELLHLTWSFAGTPQQFWDFSERPWRRRFTARLGLTQH